MCGLFVLKYDLKSVYFSAEEKKFDIADIKGRIEAGDINFMPNNETIETKQQYVKSNVWVDFRRILVPNDSMPHGRELVTNFVWCLHCQATVAYHGSTTTRLLDHQKKCPKRPFDKVNEESKATINFKLDELANLKAAAAEFIVLDMRPYFAIEGKGILSLIYAGIQMGLKYPRITLADLRKALPTRNTVVAKVSEMAEKGKSLLTRKLRNAINVSGKIAATTDLWTEPHNSTAILALTVHFFTIEGATIKLETYTADLRKIDAHSITGAIIKDAIFEMFADFGVTGDEVREYVCMVTDRGSNMLAAISELDSERCLAHLCNNVVGHMLKVPEVKEILGKSTNLVRFMKTSHAGSHMTSKLKSFPETRFNYAHDMLQSICSNHEQVFEVLSTKGDATNNDLTDKITCLPIDKMKSICDLLVFFKNVTTTIEGDKYVTINRVWPVLRKIQSVLQPKSTDCDLVASMKIAGLAYITKPENEKHFTPSMRHKLAVFLHPHMNRLAFLNFLGKL